MGCWCADGGRWAMGGRKLGVLVAVLSISAAGLVGMAAPAVAERSWAAFRGNRVLFVNSSLPELQVGPASDPGRGFLDDRQGGGHHRLTPAQSVSIFTSRERLNVPLGDRTPSNRLVQFDFNNGLGRPDVSLLGSEWD